MAGLGRTWEGGSLLVQYAKELGLDIERFNKDRASAEVKKRIDEDVNEAARLGSTGTPAFYVNGRYVRGARSLISD